MKTPETQDTERSTRDFSAGTRKAGITKRVKDDNDGDQGIVFFG